MRAESAQLTEMKFQFYFSDSLRMLKQQVIWKYEEDKYLINRIPPNVMIRKWLPQSDILAHKNVRLFISHAGMFGTFEVRHNIKALIFLLHIMQDQIIEITSTQCNFLCKFCYFYMNLNFASVFILLRSLF